MLTTFSTPISCARSGRFALCVDASCRAALQTFVALYGSWMELLRQPRAVSACALARRGIGMLLLYAVRCGGIVIASAVNLTCICEAWFAQRFDLCGPRPHRHWSSSAPPRCRCRSPCSWCGPVATSRRSSRHRALPPPTRGVDQGRAPRRTLVLALQVGALLAVGLVIVAVTQPFRVGSNC